MTNKHTPGPWKVTGGTVRGTRGQLIAQCVTAPGEASPEAEAARNERNARLIAAAPEMLEALWRCVKELENHENASGIVSEVIEESRAAIAKAEGEES